VILDSSAVVAVFFREPGYEPLLLRFLQESAVTVAPFGEPHWRAAAEAYLRYGRGRHPAGLNFGDCLAYATARLAAQALLCVGEDFGKTDLPLA
jgi:ribonuclease VapC